MLLLIFYRAVCQALNAEDWYVTLQHFAVCKAKKTMTYSKVDDCCGELYLCFC